MQKEKGMIKSRIAASVFALIIMAGSAFALSGCSSDPQEEQVATSTLVNQSPASSADLYCHEFDTYSGAFVEDGKNVEVKDVAAILVENRSQVFLDRATVMYKYGDKTATFVVTGLPAGKKCWVLESSKLQIDGKHEFEFDDCISAFKEDAVLQTDKVSVETSENRVTIKNTSMKTLKNICVYYKNTYGDGNYLGGITYMVVAASLNPGESLTKETGHFSDSSQIVRYSFQEE